MQTKLIVFFLLGLFPGALVALLGWLDPVPAMGAGAALGLAFAFFPQGRPKHLRQILDFELGYPLQDLQIVTNTHPSFRFVDLYRACEAAIGSEQDVKKVEEHEDVRLSVLNPGYNANGPARTRAAKVFPVSPDETVTYRTAMIWLAPAKRLVVRVYEFDRFVTVEVAADTLDEAARIQKEIEKASFTNSIFRGQFVHIDQGQEIHVEPGYSVPGMLQLRFHEADPVHREDIVLEPKIEEALVRNVLDIQQKREALQSKGIPTRRGVLLYGPPGTGKTFTCRYLAECLTDTTILAVSGSGLRNVTQCFSLARSLAPTLLILEDADLVFSERERNFQNQTLGNMMDELDGLKENDRVSVLMTTNSIERIERAIRDRPGRISQAIYLGPPSAPLRERYLRHHLRDEELERIDLAKVCGISEGASQAFLIAWVHRARQFALEAGEMSTECFSDALDEMIELSKGAEKLLGFSL